MNLYGRILRLKLVLNMSCKACEEKAKQERMEQRKETVDKIMSQLKEKLGVKK